MWPIAAASLIAFTSLLSAADNKSDKSKNSCECCNIAGEGPDLNNAFNPAVRPKVPGGDLSFTAAALIWEAHQDGLAFAIENINSPAVANPSTLNEARFQNLNFKWDWGVRLGLGYNFEHDGWDVQAYWTYVRSHASKHVAADTDSSVTLQPIFSMLQRPLATPTITATDIDADWTCKLNYVDLELGREFWASKWLSMRPFIGLRGVWIDQDYEIEHRGANINATGFVDEIDFDNNFKGLGIRGGLNTQWGFGCGFSFFGDLALSTIYGRFSVDGEEESEQTVTPFADTDLAEWSDSFRVSRLAVDLGLGLRFEHMFGDNKDYLFMMSLGWENHMFLNMNQLWRAQSANFTAGGGTNTDQYIFVPESGDLTYQGWTLSVKFDF